MYRDLLEKAGGALEGLTPVPSSEIAEVLAYAPGMPEDYRVFLEDVGFGEIGTRLMLYNGLVGADEIFGASVPDEIGGGFWIFGDDFLGVNYAFDKQDWSIVRIDASFAVERLASSFADFIRRFLGA